MRESNYIPGFDWVRIFGPILVAAGHVGAFKMLKSQHWTVYDMINVVVPVFFYIAGYLCARNRQNMKNRIKKQVVKYAAIYLSFEFALVLHDHIGYYHSTGYFDTARFMLDFLKCFITRYKDSLQLWFIPALLYPMMLNAFLNEKSRKLVIGALLLVYLVTKNAVDPDMEAVFEQLTAMCPLVAKVFSAAELNRIWFHMLEGFLFTTIGFDLSTWKIRPVYLLLMTFTLVLLEQTVKYIGISRIFLSVLLFDGVRRLPGQLLRAYHPAISFFSATLFFMHISEIKFLRRHLKTSNLNYLLLVIGCHILATAVFCYFHRRRPKQEKIGMKENGF